jgi:hypothetical protein
VPKDGPAVQADAWDAGHSSTVSTRQPFLRDSRRALGERRPSHFWESIRVETGSDFRVLVVPEADRVLSDRRGSSLALPATAIVYPSDAAASLRQWTPFAGNAIGMP